MGRLQEFETLSETKFYVGALYTAEAEHVGQNFENGTIVCFHTYLLNQIR